MTTLIVTGAKKRTSRAGMATSIFLHSAIIIGAIVGTAHVVRPAPEKIEEHVLLYEAPKQPDPPPLPPRKAEPQKVHVAPPKAPHAPPKPQPARYVPPKAPRMIAAPTKVAVTLPPANPTAAPITEVSPVPDPGPPSPPAKADNSGSDKAGKGGGTGDGDAKAASNETFNENQVEKVVQRVTASAPRYPDSMKGAGITGEVVVRYIVGTNGRVESGSIEIVSSTNRAFSDAVRTALMNARFRPAEVGGRPVRQLVEEPYTFKLQN